MSVLKQKTKKSNGKTTKKRNRNRQYTKKIRGGAGEYEFARDKIYALSQNLYPDVKKKVVKELIVAMKVLSNDDRERLMSDLKLADSVVYYKILNENNFDVELGGFKRSKKSRRSRK